MSGFRCMSKENRSLCLWCPSTVFCELWCAPALVSMFSGSKGTWTNFNNELQQTCVFSCMHVIAIGLHTLHLASSSVVRCLAPMKIHVCNVLWFLFFHCHWVNGPRKNGSLLALLQAYCRGYNWTESTYESTPTSSYIFLRLTNFCVGSCPVLRVWNCAIHSIHLVALHLM